ncbi:MAG: hypothetical protein K1060chlam5_00429 [Candidatus Anoxychlamydiales bacterium]|nr:hypothetical protein [Candidatus Anoxychlamydiales bacterium]
MELIIVMTSTSLSSKQETVNPLKPRFEIETIGTYAMQRKDHQGNITTTGSKVNDVQLLMKPVLEAIFVKLEIQPQHPLDPKDVKIHDFEGDAIIAYRGQHFSLKDCPIEIIESDTLKTLKNNGFDGLDKDATECKTTAFKVYSRALGIIQANDTTVKSPESSEVKPIFVSVPKKLQPKTEAEKKADHEALAKAEAKAKADHDALAEAQAKAKGKAGQEALTKAEAKAKAEQEALAKAEEEVKTKFESNLSEISKSGTYNIIELLVIKGYEQSKIEILLKKLFDKTYTPKKLDKNEEKMKIDLIRIFNAYREYLKAKSIDTKEHFRDTILTITCTNTNIINKDNLDNDSVERIYKELA